MCVCVCVCVLSVSTLGLSKAKLLIYLYSVPKFEILEYLPLFFPITTKTDLSTRPPELNIISAYIISFRTNYFQPTLKLSPSFTFKEAFSTKLHKAEISRHRRREVRGYLKGKLPGNACKWTSELQRVLLQTTGLCLARVGCAGQSSEPQKRREDGGTDSR